MKEKVELSGLSERAQPLVSSAARIDMDLFMEALENQYDSEENPDGAFALNVAENKIMGNEVRRKLNDILSRNDFPEWVMGYTSMSGHPEVRESLAKFMQHYFGSKKITADTICLTSGAAAALEILSFVLSDPDDVVVIPAPAYPVYTSDLGIKSRMERFDLQTHFEIADQASLALVNPEILESTFKELENAGKTFKMLIITTPDNPSGCIYSKEQLNQIADWCENKSVHFVVNEIYALSLIDIEDPEIAEEYPNGFRYESFSKIMAERQSPYLHLIYALSKDFCISGMRFGIVHSLNPAVMKALSAVNIPHMISNLTQWMIARFFNDEEYIDHYVIENQKALTRSYKCLIQFLKSWNVPYVPSRGSLFIWADFSQFLKANSEEDEMRFWMDIYKNTGVLLTPGNGFGHLKKGLFRIVFSAVNYKDLQTALKRLDSYILKLK